MDALPVAHAELGRGGLMCGEVNVAGQLVEMGAPEFVAWASSQPLIVTWGGKQWAEAAHVEPSRLIDLNETFKAANGFAVRLGAFPHSRLGGRSMSETVRSLVDYLGRHGRLKWQTRKGVPRGFWVPDFTAPLSSLEYAPSPFLG